MRRSLSCLLDLLWRNWVKKVWILVGRELGLMMCMRIVFAFLALLLLLLLKR